MKKIYTCIILLIILITLASTQPSCSSVPYPKVFGGYKGDTFISQMDFQQRNLVAAGYTLDSDISGESSAQVGIVIGIVNDIFQYAKRFKDIATDFKQITLKPDGSGFVALTKGTEILMTFDTTTGDLQYAKSISGKGITQLTLSNSYIYVMTIKDTSGYQMIQLDFPELLTNWALQSASINSKALALSQCPDNQYLHTLHQASEGYLTLTTIQTSTGSEQYAIRYGPFNQSSFFLSSLNYNNYVIVQSDFQALCEGYQCLNFGGTGRKVISVQYLDSNYIYIVFTQASSVAMIRLYVGYTYYYNRTTPYFYYQSYNYYQIRAWSGDFVGKFNNGWLAAVFSKADIILMGSTNQVAKLQSPYKQAVFLTSNYGNTCQQYSEMYYYTYGDSTIYYISSSYQSSQFTTLSSTALTLTDQLSTITPNLSTVPSFAILNQNMNSFCSNNNLLLKQTGTYDKITLNFKASIAYSEIIPSIANVTCTPGGTNTATYSIEMASGSGSVPSYISINPTAGTMSLTTDSLKGTISLKVTMTISTGLSNFYYLDLIFTNNAPVLTSSLYNQVVSLNSTLTYQLPTFHDDENNIITMSTYLKNAIDLPNWVTYDQPSRTYTISPTEFSQLGDFLIVIKLEDAYGSTTYEFRISSKNSAPYFVTSIPSQTMSWNVGIKTQILPNAVDDERNQITITVYDYYNHNTLPSFISFDGDKTITYSPLLANVGNYLVEVKLTDAQPNYRTVAFYVYVTNIAPSFATSLVQQNASLNGVPITYQLPAYSDPDGTICSLTVLTKIGTAYSPLPSFIIFADNKFIINPGQYEFTAIGTHCIEVNLTDASNQLTKSQFYVVISNQAPFFASSPPNWTGKLSTATYTYTLPSYSDSEGHAIQVSIFEIATSILPPFMTFASDVLTMTVLDTDFAISLTNTAPKFLASLQTQVFPLNGTVFEYVLPVQSDDEGQTIVATTKESGKTSLPAFVTFDGLKYTIAPGLTDFQFVGIYYIEIILSDGNLQTSNYFYLNITNTVPYFLTAPATTFTIPMDFTSQENYTLPASKDDEGHPITTIVREKTKTTLPSFITFTASDISMIPSAFTDVGFYTIEINLSDGMPLNKTYYFTVNVTNTAPTFVTSPLSNQALPINSTLSYSIPAQTDVEGNSVIITSMMSNYSPLLSFITFAGDTFTFSPILFADVKTHTILVTLADGQPKMTNYTFTVTVSNTSPYLITTPLLNQQCALNSQITYTIPGYKDDENNPVTITWAGSPVAMTTFDQATLTFTFTPTLFSQVTTHTVTVNLSDTNKQTTYSFILTVTNTAPYFITSPLATFTQVLGYAYTYTLPDITDDEGNVPSLSITSKPSFITVNGVANFVSLPVLDSNVGPQSISIVLTDSQKTTTYTLAYTISPNLLPTFSVAQLPNQTVKLNFTQTVSLPSYSDPEGMPVTVTYYYSPLTYNQVDDNTTEVSTTDFARVGDNYVRVILSDGFRNKEYGFYVTVTNSAPYLNTPPANQIFQMNQSHTITLPLFKDNENNPVFVVPISLPSYLTFVSPNQFQLLASSFSDITTQTVIFNLTDTQLQTPYEFHIEIYNTAPYFQSTVTLPPVTMRYFNPYSIDLPLILDDEFNPVFITAMSNKSTDPLFFTLTEKSYNLWSLTLLPKKYEYVWTPNLISITLNDTNLFTTYTFVLTVTNEAPVFVAGVLDLVINQKMNDMVYYEWPDYVDPEGDSESVLVKVVTNSELDLSVYEPKYADTFGCLSIDKNGVFIQATKFSQVGTKTFLVALRDGEPKQNFYNLEVTITNSAPYFLSNPTGKLGNVRVRLGEATTWDLPPFKDEEDNPIFVSNTADTDFIKFSAKRYTFTPTLPDQIGLFPIYGTLYDGQPLSTPFSLTLIVYNDPPFFTDDPEDRIFAPLNLRTQYIFPNVKDLEKLPVDLTVSSLSNWPKFLTIQRNTSQVGMIMLPENQEQIGEYQLVIQLSDTGKATKIYFLTIIVKDIGVTPSSGQLIQEQISKSLNSGGEIIKLGLRATSATNNGIVKLRITNSQGIGIKQMKSEYFQINVINKEQDVSFDIESLDNQILTFKLNFKNVERISNSVVIIFLLEPQIIGKRYNLNYRQRALLPTCEPNAKSSPTSRNRDLDQSPEAILKRGDCTCSIVQKWGQYGDNCCSSRRDRNKSLYVRISQLIPSLQFPFHSVSVEFAQ
ncbi:hypothetical protein FGO68_gene456 [Halteria grandinella]|uniref:Dystroglycan-type cadherin-like domain-containing protein n=1 Tax=Halteria grandinella TaxID=5974 RepID=A0A8J8P667_HALGN|nr:hypothetical protein FGO68_gene456 [Halteria grandinella]